MLLRVMEERDNLAVAQLIRTSLEQLDMAEPGTAYTDPHLAYLFEYYDANKERDYWVIEDQGQIIGGVGIAELAHPNTCELQKMYVTTAARGQGLARRLMNRALEFAEKNYQVCYLETHTKLETACRLYESYGFQLLNQPLIITEHSAMDKWYLKKLI